MEQLKLAIDSFEVELSEENLNYLDEVHAACPNPCP
jgi:aryl-alcohol dehydrogenase-like predicted oxidoreductase